MRDWSAWVIGLVGLLYAIYSDLRARRARSDANHAQAATRRIRATLGRVIGADEALHPVEVTSNGAAQRGVTSSPDDENGRLRSMLIQTAFHHAPFSVVLARARELEIPPDVVRVAAQHYRDTKLLQFPDPLTDETEIQLA